MLNELVNKRGSMLKSFDFDILPLLCAAAFFTYGGGTKLRRPFGGAAAPVVLPREALTKYSCPPSPEPPSSKILKILNDILKSPVSSRHPKNGMLK